MLAGRSLGETSKGGSGAWPNEFPEKPHARPYQHVSSTLDWNVWRKIVDEGIKRPEIIKEQVQRRQAELQAQGDDVNSEIAHARQRLDEVDANAHFIKGRRRVAKSLKPSSTQGWLKPKKTGVIGNLN